MVVEDAEFLHNLGTVVLALETQRDQMPVVIKPGEIVLVSISYNFVGLFDVSVEFQAHSAQGKSYTLHNHFAGPYGASDDIYGMFQMKPQFS